MDQPHARQVPHYLDYLPDLGDTLWEFNQPEWLIPEFLNGSLLRAIVVYEPSRTFHQQTSGYFLSEVLRKQVAVHISCTDLIFFFFW